MATPYVGEIRIFAGNFAPAGWAICNGALVAISDNDTLFNLIGTTYGGDGQSTFALPDLQSRIPVHQGSGGGANYVLADTGGVEAVTLNLNQIPNHSHAPLATSTGANTANPANANFAAWPDSPFAVTQPAAPMAGDTLTPIGGNQPHENMPPYLAINFIISLFGIYPSQT